MSSYSENTAMAAVLGLRFWLRRGGIARRQGLTARSCKPALELLEDRRLLDAAPVNPVAPFVTGLYQDLLLRSPQPAEVDYWVGRINHGLPRPQVAEQFVHSAEYGMVQIEQDYVQLLSRMPEAPALDGWLQALQAGMTPEQLT